jgi:hypothetical protein
MHERNNVKCQRTHELTSFGPWYAIGPNRRLPYTSLPPGSCERISVVCPQFSSSDWRVFRGSTFCRTCMCIASVGDMVAVSPSKSTSCRVCNNHIIRPLYGTNGFLSHHSKFESSVASVNCWRCVRSKQEVFTASVRKKHPLMHKCVTASIFAMLVRNFQSKPVFKVPDKTRSIALA